jgi:GT2 family glycosyltransferase
VGDTGAGGRSRVTSPRVVSVILNTNRREDTLECLESVARGTYPNHQTFVLDNASTDGSVEAIGKRFPHARVIRLTANGG